MPNLPRRFAFFSHCVFAAALGLGVPVLAQFQLNVNGPAGDAQKNHDDKATPAGVSVPDSPGASERLDKAADKENQKQWKNAAEFYQEALVKFPSRVVAVRREPDKGIYYYQGIAPLVQERLAKWPAEGLVIYRNLYGTTAADLLNAAPRGDVGALRNIFWNYFATDAGKTAGMRLLDNDMETGDFQAASWIGHRLLKLHPALGADRSTLLYRTALASCWAGDTDAARKLLDQLKLQAPNEVGSIGGKDVVLVDSLAAVLAAPPLKPTARPSDADTYPSFGGLGERGDISPSAAVPGASLNSITLTPPDVATLMGAQHTQYQANDQNSLLNYQEMGIMPVVDAGALFFQDGRCIYAVDTDSGAPLPGWLSTYGGERLGRYKLNLSGRARNELLTLTVTPTSVVAVMGQPDRFFQGQNFQNGFVGQVQNGPASPEKLVCLDRDTGRELWTRTPPELPESVATLRTAAYTGTPLVIPAAVAGRGPAAVTAAPGGAGPVEAGSPTAASAEDSVLVVARGGKDNQFDDCYVVCLSLKTGQYRWSTYVGSATRTFDNEGATSIQPSQLSLANGRVFVMTNLGNVAALDPTDGRILWLNSYARDSVENPEAIMMGGGRRFNPMQANSAPPGHAWAHNPVFVSGGYVYVLPNDAKQLFVYDQGSGELARQLPMSAFGNADVLVGIRNGVICLTSENGVYAVDWRKFDENKPANIVPWSEPDITDKDGNPGGEPSTVCGRSFATADSIFIPTKFRLIQKTWKSGRTVQQYPKHGVFTGEQGAGNILVTAQNVVVAGQERVDVYTDLTLVRQRFETAMAASPGDPLPRMQYAEALFAGGREADSLDKVDQAIALAGGLNSMHSGKDRAMIFASMLDFARRIDKNSARTKSSDTGDTDQSSASASGLTPENIRLANQFLDRAAAAADSPAQQATYRLARAKFDHDIADYAGEVHLCQEILSDDAMRNALLANDVPAGSSAESAIEAASKIDPNAYADIEARAKDALKTAIAAGEPKQLLDVATVYPNSHAAGDAREEAVHRFEAGNEPEKAIDVLRRIYLGTIEPTDRAKLLVQIANDFLAMHEGVGPAIDRLSHAARIAPSTASTPLNGQQILFPDGSVHTTITEAIAGLRQIQADKDTQQLPDFHLAKPTRGATSPFIPGPTPVGSNADSDPGAWTNVHATAVIPNVTALVHPLRDFVRNDQILTWSSAGLSIFPAGQTSPLATLDAVDQPPLAAAWVHDNWFVWTAGKVCKISGDGKLVWMFSAEHLPTLAVTSGTDAVVDDANEPNADDAVVQVNGGFMRVNGRVVQIPPGGQFINGRVIRAVGGGAMVAPPPVVPAPPILTGDEHIISVQPAGPAAAQLLISTSIGRVIAVDSRNGQMIWETRPMDHAVDELLANAHFTVLRLDDPGGSQIAVYDTPTGRIIGRRRYGPDNTPRQLVNVALSEEGTLALTLFNQIWVKDLYDAWKVPPVELSAQANRDAAPFVGLSQPDQLLIKAGRLVCLYDSGSWARGYDLSKNADPTNPLDTRAPSAAVSMRFVGSKVFIVTANDSMQYDLADSTGHPRLGHSVDTSKLHGLLLGRHYAVIVADTVDRGPVGSPLVNLEMFSRALIPGKTQETANLDWAVRVQSDAGITDWLGAEGSICYLTKDGNLHLLKGARAN
jgi:outer membrane protein assembly factor BamB